MELHNRVIGYAKCLAEVGGFKKGGIYEVLYKKDFETAYVKDEDGDAVQVRLKYFQIDKLSVFLEEKVEVALRGIYPTDDIQSDIAHRGQFMALVVAIKELAKEEIREEMRRIRP